MDMRRGQLSKDAVASTSGRHVLPRPSPIGLPSHRLPWVSPATRPNLSQRYIASTHVSVVVCRATPGEPSAIRPTTTTTTTTITIPTPPLPPNGTAVAATAVLPSQQHAQPPQQPQSAAEEDSWHSSVQRVLRLSTLVETRRLYRNIVRAEYLLNLPNPLYTPPPSPAGEQAEGLAASGSSASASGSSSEGLMDLDSDRLSNGGSSSAGSFGNAASVPRILSGPEEDKALKAALDSVAEMALVLEQLKASLRSLPAGFGTAIFPAATASASEETVREVARQNVLGLRERLAAEIPLLPISSDAAIHYIESRNAKFSRRVALDELQGGGSSGTNGSVSNGSGSTSGGGGGSISGGAVAPGGLPGADLTGASSSLRATPLERLEAAERAAGEIIANRIKPALKRASEQDLVQVVQDAGSYLKGLWVRLNGGAPAPGRWGGWKGMVADTELPRPEGTQQRSELAISRLSLDLEALEKRLQEASKKRENKLRKAGLQGRVQMAIQLKGLDAEVLYLSSLLAVRTLQLEMEHVYGSLEAEALDIFNGLHSGGLLIRDGSTNELALLVAEFALLDEQLTLMAAALEAGAAGGAAASDDGAAEAAAVAAAAAAAAAMGPALINDEVLSKLAVEIPDMRSRVGVADQVVFGGQGFSLTKARLQIRESLDKVREAVTFLSRGFKLLGSDMATGARLFLKAALGNTLKPREVSALRRTARDLLTFIPFTIILIIPLSPLGHVLVFGFIQRYFPSFFPSQFSTRRQEIMVRYEELERQLLEAQAAVEEAEEEVELARAREAVARLIAPEPPAAPVAEAPAGGGTAVGKGDDVVGAAPAASAPVGGTLRGVHEADDVSAAVAAAAAGTAATAPVAVGGGAAAATPVGSMSALSSVDEVTLQEAAKKVRILAEQLDEIRDDVHLVDPLSEAAGGEMAGNQGGGRKSKLAHGSSGSSGGGDGGQGRH
ncbi:hypothetical protein Vafri_7097 [Volvox africanus]|uniref:Letm1 RBD domain-containing protein n=1 Tax=Volvox africanus TaxID=51714 RepID=A0A8J4F0D7_9CHLO|nr:hypothetical protein Vafri_7097 [Volvox africanus]